jgi:hypothetical protein
VWKCTGGGYFTLTLNGAGRFVDGRAETLFLQIGSFRCAGKVLGIALHPDGKTAASAGEGPVSGGRVHGGMRPVREMPSPGALNLWELR